MIENNGEINSINANWGAYPFSTNILRHAFQRGKRKISILTFGIIFQGIIIFHVKLPQVNIPKEANWLSDLTLLLLDHKSLF